MADVRMTLEEYEALRSMAMVNNQVIPSEAAPPKKKRKKVSKYSREFGRQMKALKKKHPRTKSTQLMKRAHAATRKAMK